MALLVDDTTQTSIAVAAGSIVNTAPSIARAGDEVAQLASAVRTSTLPTIDKWIKIYVVGSLMVLFAGQALLAYQRRMSR